ncbi:MAG: penicillin-binding protein activator LpoB [Sedimentisphaerales bacterium]|jgi:penicillin-binding protein activator
MIKNLLPFIMLAAVAGCTPPTQNVDTINDQGKPVMGLDYRDFDRAASQMVQSMIESGTFKKEGGGRYVVAKGHILNDTMQRIDTDQLMAKVEQEMTRSGLIVMTAAVGGGTASRDSMVHDMRDIRNSDKGDEFKQDTLPAKGQLLAPELSISGKIIQRNVKYENNQQQVEYYFQLQMNNITNGLVFWQNEIVMGKRGSNKSVSW